MSAGGFSRSVHLKKILFLGVVAAISKLNLEISLKNLQTTQFIQADHNSIWALG